VACAARHSTVHRIVIVERCLEERHVLVAAGVDRRRQMRGLIGGQAGEAFLPDGRDDLARRIRSDELDAGSARVVEDLAVVAPVIAPSVIPVAAREELFLVPATVPAVEAILAGVRKHLERDRDVAPRIVEGANHLQLDAMRLDARVRLPHEHEPRLGQPCPEARRRDRLTRGRIGDRIEDDCPVFVLPR